MTTSQEIIQKHKTNMLRIALANTLAAAPDVALDALVAELRYTDPKTLMEAAATIRDERPGNYACAIAAYGILFTKPELQARVPEALIFGLLALSGGAVIDPAELFKTLTSLGIPAETAQQIAGSAQTGGLAVAHLGQTIAEFLIPALMTVGGLAFKKSALVKAGLLGLVTAGAGEAASKALSSGVVDDE